MLSFMDILAILLYLGVMVYIAVTQRKKVKTSKDFGTANKALGIFVTIGTLAGTAIGTASTMGLAGNTYTEGVSAYWYIISWSIGWAVLALVAKRVYATGATSVSDMFGKKYGENVRTVAAIVSLMFGIAALSAQISGLGSLLSKLGESLGISYQLATVIITILMIIMVYVGGLFAVAFTDTFNFVILAFAFCLVLPIVLLVSLKGNVGSNIASLPAEKVSLVSGVSVGATIATIIKYCFTASTNVAYVQRTLASKDEKVAQNGHWGGIIAHAFVALIIMIAALAFTPVYTDLKSADLLLPTIIIDHFPVFLRGLAIAGMIAVIFSTASTWLQITGQVTGTDLFPVLKKDATDKQMLLVSRIGTAFWGIVAVIAALAVPNVLKLFGYGSTIYGAGMFFPFMCLLFWKKLTGKGAIAGMLVGAFSAVLWSIFKPIPSLDPVIVGSVLSGLCTFLVSLATQKKEA